MPPSISHRQLARQLIEMLEERTALRPRVAMLLGSGHASIVNQLKDKVVIPGQDIPGQALPTPILVGILEGMPVAVADAPLASYEGLTSIELAHPVRVLKALGCELLVLTAGAASLSQQIERGSIAVVEDHLNLSGMHPLVGPNDDQLGPRFPDMSEPYHRKWLEIIRKVAIDAGVPFRAACLPRCLDRACQRAPNTASCAKVVPTWSACRWCPKQSPACTPGLKCWHWSASPNKCSPATRRGFRLKR